jgi:hypothetical protein
MMGNEELSPFATECNHFLRALGCQFSGDVPGSILEEMADEARCSKSSNQSFVRRVSAEDSHFHYPGPRLKRPLKLLWRMLGLPIHKPISDFEWFASKHEAVACMRVFCELANRPLTNARELALKFLEMRVEQLSK